MTTDTTVCCTPHAAEGEPSAPAIDTPGRGPIATQGRAELTASSTEGVRSLPGQPAPFAPIPGSDGYFLTADGRVLSAPKRRMFGGRGWREVAIIDGKVRLPVRVGSGTVMRRRSLRGLAREVFGGAA